MNLSIYKTLNYLIAAIWLINGLYCKVLNFIPRHQEIVANILGFEHAVLLTKIIGFSEIIMAIWILTQYKYKLNAIAQMLIIAIMNCLEFFLVPDLLLWGKFNALFAGLFIVLIFCNTFIFAKNQNTQHV